MKLQARIATLTGALALAAIPATASAGPPDATGPSGPPDATGPEYQPAPPPPPPHAKAYGRYCKGASKKHVKGERGTEFSRCVTAMARAATHENMPPGRACKGESRKHVKGEKGTAFSRCVKAVAQLRKDQNEEGA